jgi:hypothetical protein
MLEIIKGIEAQRDNFVRRCNAAIEALRGGGDSPAALGNNRFSAAVAPQPANRAANTGRGTPSRPANGVEESQNKAAGGRVASRDAKSVKDMIREAVRSQTQPFTLRDVKVYVQERYPAAASKIAGKRYSKELYHLRVTERLFEISSKGEKGGAHVYKLKAA